jgi:hypothetical protein
MIWLALSLTGCETELKISVIDSNVMAYEFSPSRDVVYHLKREANEKAALWVYDVKGRSSW